MSSSTRKPNKNCSKKEEMSLYKRQKRRINYGAKSPHGCVKCTPKVLCLTFGVHFSDAMRA